MKKILFLLLLLFPISIYALELPHIDSKVVEIYDLNDDKILHEIDSNREVAIASLTKIATTITAIETIEDLDKQVTITSTILSSVNPEASVAGLKVGDQLTYRDLLYASMLPSGADATNSIAIISCGSIDNFVAKMNELVKRIGLEKTHFVNVTGLDEKGHYSTADEVRKLLEYALKNDTFKEIFTTKEKRLSNGLLVKTTLYTYNKTGSFDTSMILGSKTGFTLEAGYCLSSLSNINGHEMLVIVLNAPKKGNEFYNIIDTVHLIDFLNNNYKEELLVENNKLIKAIPVDLSHTEEVKVYSNQELKKYLPSDFDPLMVKIQYEGPERLDYKNKEGEKFAEIKYYFGDDLLYKQDVVLNEKLEVSLKKVIFKYRIPLIIGCIILVVVIIIIIKRKKRKK